MKDRIHHRSTFVYVLIAFILFWILLFQFILPYNFILPKPYFVILSFSDLITGYHIITNLFSTLSSVYVSIILSYLVLWVLRIYLVKGNNIIRFKVAALRWFAGFIPSIIIALFLIYWLGSSEYVKYIFGFFSCLILLFIKLEDELSNMGNEYIDAAVSLGARSGFIAGKIRWKSVEPAVTRYIPEMHIYIWSMIIIIEFIKGGAGLGVVFHQALIFRDLPVLFSTALFTVLFIFFVEIILKYINNRIFPGVRIE